MTGLTAPSKEKFFWAGIAVGIALHLLFYPSIYAFFDEAAYFAMTEVFRSGSFRPGPSDVLPSWVFLGGHRIPDYPYGMPLLLLPLSHIGWPAVFIAGLAAHLAGAFYFSRLLRTFDLDHPFLIWLYLFHPAMLFYSRTIMSDLPAAALILAGASYYYRESGWKTGLCFGLSLLIRPTGIAFMIPFLLAAFVQPARKPAAISALFVPAALVAFFLNPIAYGVPAVDWYRACAGVIPLFSVSYFSGNFLFYLAALMLSWPLMALAPFFARRTRRFEMLGSIASGLFFFSLYYFRDHFGSPARDLVFGIRFMLPAVAFLLLMYAEALNPWLVKMGAVQVRLLAGTIAAMALVIHAGHQHSLRPQLAMKESIYRSTPENSTLIYDQFSSELMQRAWGDREFIYWKDFDKSLPEFLEQADFEKGVYLITRKEPGKLDLSWVSANDMQIGSRIEAQPVAREGMLEIYRLKAR
jgi:hypothetical protein